MASDDIGFRTEVLVKLAEISRDVTHVKGTLEETKEALAEHIEHDNERFGTVNQKIGENSGSIAKGAGILACLVALSAFVMWLIDKVKP